MDMNSQKEIAAKIMKCGVSRVRIRQAEEVEEALTREDIRGLIQKGIIWKVQKAGTSKYASKKRLDQKAKGRMNGPGKRKGTTGARKNDKTKWMEKVRALRKMLSELKESGQVEGKDYGILYRRIKGGFFRNKKHLLYYLKEHDILRKGEGKKAGRAKVRARLAKRTPERKKAAKKKPAKPKASEAKTGKK